MRNALKAIVIGAMAAGAFVAGGPNAGFAAALAEGY